MTKEEVLQKANDYCSEKGYTSETLTEEFKEKFSDFFAKKYQDKEIDDEGVISDMQFSLNTAFSATSKGITSKVKAFDEKEKDYQKQIDELTQALAKTKVKTKDKKDDDLPKELKDKLDELEKFKVLQTKQEKYKEIIELAKKNVRPDLHKSFETYSKDYDVKLDEANEEQAKKLTERFQDIFRDSIGDIKPLAPKQIQKRDDEIISQIPKVKVV